MEALSNHVPVLGIALVLAFAGGKIAHNIRLPQVTLYILVGVLLGPTVFNLMTTEMAESYHSINQLAFGLILFNIGGQFHGGLFKSITWTQIKFSTAFAGILFIIVFSICFLFSLFSDLSMAQKLVFSSFLGVVSIAAAPPTTLLVIKELDAKGPLTRSIIVYLAVGTVISIISAHALTFIFQDVGVWKGGHGNYLTQIFFLIWSLVGSLLIGTVLGLLLSYWEQRERVESELLLATICAVLLGQTLSYYLTLEPLLVSLFMGFSLVNSSPAGKAIHARIKGMGLSIYALFFVLAGAHIHLQEQIQTIGILGLGYLIARTIGMFIASKMAARFTQESPMIGRTLGFSVLSHAGAALAIVTKIQGQTDESAYAIITVVMASIFAFEILGPLVLRFTLIRAGEVKAQALFDDPTIRTSLTGAELIQNFLQNLGLIRPADFGDIHTVSLLVKRNIIAISAKASFKEVIDFVDSHHLPIYPVVGSDDKYEGIISISELKDVIFNPFRSRLNLASRFIGSRAYIVETATFDEALESFNDSDLEVLPVVHPHSKKLLGTLSYKDVIVAMKRSPEKEETAFEAG